MKNIFIYFLISVSALLFSCGDAKLLKSKNDKNTSPVKAKKTASESNRQDKYMLNPADISSDFKSWYTYNQNNIRLSQDFVALGVDSSIIEKPDFFEQLLTGNYIPLKIMVENNKPVYKLYSFNSPDLDIKRTIRQMAATQIAHYKMEGKELPAYSFTDLSGKTYNKTTTKGKIVVLKCWFIQCVACVKEFPELNKLVRENEDKDNILFISLAIDSKQNLISFLNTREFRYAVVPDMQAYMQNQLGVTEYPTHILIDRNGRIIKVVNAVDDLIPFLKEEFIRN